MKMQHGAWQEKMGTDCSEETLAVPEGARDLGGVPFGVAKEPSTVDFIDYPDLTELPPGHGNWNMWGIGTTASDGCFYSAVGDHGGKDANTYITQYVPKRQAIRRVLTTQELTNHKPGSCGHGKIHCQMDEVEGGWIIFATYFAQKPTEQQLNDNFTGGVIGQYNIYTGEAENFGAPIPKVWFPTGMTDARRMLFHLQAEGMSEEDDGVACYDLKARTMRFYGGHGVVPITRGIMLEPESGVSYVGAISPEGKACMGKYDPESNTLSTTKALMPAGENQGSRALTPRKTAEGYLFGSTWSGTLFKFDPAKETLDSLGPNFGNGVYAPVMEISPGDRYLYYVPAKTDAETYGTPVFQFDTHERRLKILAFLAPYYKAKYGYRPQGTFCVKLDPSGSVLYVPMNGADNVEGSKGAFYSHPTLFVLHIPASERRE
jgi:hypothetical protein